MQPLRSVLTAFAERPDVAGAIVVSEEGLIVESALPGGMDAEAIAAHAAEAAKSLAELAASLGQHALVQFAGDGPDGAFVLQRLPSGATLLALAAPDGDLGELLHDLRRHAPALASLA